MKYIFKYILLQVPVIPTGCLKKAAWYVQNKKTHTRTAYDGEGNPMWYVLRQSNPGKYKSINNHLVRLYEKASKGEKHKDIKTLDYLLDVCFSMHPVCEPPDGYKVCMHA